jgi:deoxyadenosine/deoxycytidine kinase
MASATDTPIISFTPIGLARASASASASADANSGVISPQSTTTVPFIIAVEGNIGSGKTTLVEVMREHITKFLTPDVIAGREIIFYEEPLDEWAAIRDSAGETMLAKFYADQKKYAFAFQIMALMSRLEIFHRLIRNNPNSIIICERSMLTHRRIFFQMLADDGVIDDVCFQVYKRWFDHMIDEINVAGYVYVRADPAVSHRRVLKRAREGETIPLEYLAKCHRYHETWLREIAGNKILVLNGNVELPQENVAEEYTPWLQEIALFITQQDGWDADSSYPRVEYDITEQEISP